MLTHNTHTLSPLAGLSHLQKQRLMNMNNKYEGSGSGMPFSSNQQQQQTRMHTNNPAQFSVEDDLGTYCELR
jgi:hypothetical protein